MSHGETLGTGQGQTTFESRASDSSYLSIKKGLKTHRLGSLSLGFSQRRNIQPGDHTLSLLLAAGKSQVNEAYLRRCVSGRTSKEAGSQRRAGRLACPAALLLAS